VTTIRYVALHLVTALLYAHGSSYVPWLRYASIGTAAITVLAHLDFYLGLLEWLVSGGMASPLDQKALETLRSEDTKRILFVRPPRTVGGVDLRRRRSRRSLPGALCAISSAS
jgi:hypothetical protein